MSRRAISVRLGAISLFVASATSLLAQDAASPVVMLDQNVRKDILLQYHHTDQGTRLVPAAWLAVVENADGTAKFMSPENISKLGFIVDGVVTDTVNPYGWPIGFTISDPDVTGGIPISGITCAACHTGQINHDGTPIRIEGGQGMHDTDTFFTSLAAAFTATRDDPARLERFLKEAVDAGYPADRIKADFEVAQPIFNELATFKGAGVVAGRGRSDAVGGIANKLMSGALKIPSNKKVSDAPVSTPYLWDIWRLSWVQTNGFQPGQQSVGRNIGEVISVFGTTNVVDMDGKLNPEPLRWKTSIQINNLIWMENMLNQLKAPMWPTDVLGPIDTAKAQAGRVLFDRSCSSCHGIKELPNGTWDVTVPPLKRIGTDPNMAVNWAGRTYDLTILGLSDKATVPEAFPILVDAIRNQLYDEAGTPEDQREPSFKHEAPCGYKARPLIGTWATPPFLHNGSVRTLTDLLSDERPTSFHVGSLEFDPVNVGYIDDPKQPFVLDTTLKGNSNQGHWFTDDIARPGRIGPAFSDRQKAEIIEFLKSATYENYPSEKRELMAQMACQDDPDWALRR